MAGNDPQVPWSDEQWARVTQAVQKEAARSRVAATFLPLVGPLSPDTDFVKSGALTYQPPSGGGSPPAPNSQVMHVDDRTVIPLATLQVKVILRGAQVADPELTSALELFRRAANVLARLEDATVFRGQVNVDEGPPTSAIVGLPAIWKVMSGLRSAGLFGAAQLPPSGSVFKRGKPPTPGLDLVQEVTVRIGELESRGHFGPFAVVLGEELFGDAQNPTSSLVLPSDRIIPFLGGGPFLRSSTLPKAEGLIVALGAAPVELVIATDVSIGFLQVTTDPHFVFRVYEKIALRIRESDAIAPLGK